jgi:hypothetical protein
VNLQLTVTAGPVFHARALDSATNSKARMDELTSPPGSGSVDNAVAIGKCTCAYTLGTADNSCFTSLVDSYMFRSQTAISTSVPTFLRAWLLRVHQCIVLSSATRPEIAHRLHDDRPHAVQMLPDEFILEILGYLLPVQQTDSVLPCPTECSAVITTQRLVHHQTCLLWACKTCRRWYIVGTEVLYMSPLLTTTKRMELFERTLSETPSLARFVHAIYAPLRTDGATADLFGWILGRRSSTVQKEELNTTLQHCPALRSLTIRHSVRKGIVARVPITDVLQSTGLSARLENLSLHGSTFESRWEPQFSVIPPLSGLLLPNLHVLCLRGMYILPSLHLPVLPQLHTLQLVANHYFGSGPYFLSKNLPALHSVEVVEHDAPEAQRSLWELFEGRTLRHLNTLRVMRDERCVTATRSMPHDGRLRRLMLGYVTPRDHTDLACWRIPDSLESLTLVLHLSDGTQRCISAVDVAHCLGAIYSCLQSNDEAKRLKELIIIRTSEQGSLIQTDRSVLTTIVKKISDLCASRSISFEAQTSCEYCLLFN